MNDVAIHPLRGIELFSGVGMLGEGLRAGLDYLGIPYRAVCHVEREAYAASVMVARMEEGSMDAAPVWSDVCTFNARKWRGKVDCVVAGFPCQDLSVAGKRAGLDGKRSGLFFQVTRIAGDCGAWLMLLENVGGIASATATVMDEEEGELEERAAARVMGELADLGWNAEWITLSASDVGASHGRARWFCIAWRMDDAERTERRSSYSGSAGRQQGNDGRRAEAHGRAGIAEQVLGDTGLQHGDVQQRGVWPEHSGASDELADANSERRQQVAAGSHGDEIKDEGRSSEYDHITSSIGSVLAVSERIGRRQGRTEPIGHQGRLDADKRGVPVADASEPGPPYTECRELRGSGRRKEGGATEQLCSTPFLFAPGPSDKRWGEIVARAPWFRPALSIEEEHDASAAFSAAQSILWGMADGLADRLDFGNRAPRLKCVGNGVVALCAAAAVVELLRRSGIVKSTMTMRRAA